MDTVTELLKVNDQIAKLAGDITDMYAAPVVEDISEYTGPCEYVLTFNDVATIIPAEEARLDGLKRRRQQLKLKCQGETKA